MTDTKAKTREVAAVSPSPAVQQSPAVMVTAIKQRFLEQLYPSRGDLNSEPDGPAEHEVVVGVFCAMRARSHKEDV